MNAPTRRIPQAGEQLLLPSGNTVELRRLLTASLLTWQCVYVGIAWGERMTSNPKKREIALRDDWLGCWGRLT